MERRKKSLLIALCLGDGHINKRDNCLQITHSYKQKFYIEYKCKLLSELLNCKEPNLYHRLDSKHNEYKLTKGSRFFRYIRKMLYKDGEKRFSKNILKYITPEALAIWWMDDGSHGIDKNKTTGKITSHSFHLYTYTNLEDTNNIIEMLNSKFGITMYKIKRTMKDGSIKYYLKCRTKEGRKLSNLLEPYILKEFNYKIITHEQDATNNG